MKEEQTPAGSSQKEMGHYTEMFTEKTKNETAPNRLLVQGETGIGKTTFVKKLLVDLSNLDAAKMEQEQKHALRKFELVLAVNLKDVSKCQTFRQVLSHSRLFPEEEETSIDDLHSYILKNQEKVLLVFDGYDEYCTGSEAEKKYGKRSDSPVYRIFHGTNLRDCTVMVTTRSSRADELRGSADIQAEVTGFNWFDRETFMMKMLNSETEVDDLFEFLDEKNMYDLARVPLLNLFFCLLWKEEKEKLMAGTKSKTKLYQTIVRFILQHSHKKRFPNQVSKVKEENYEDILAEIGKVALAGLLKGDLVFEFGELPETVRGERSVIAGLLQLSEYAPSVEPKETVSFIHKSIQEYLAAWYVTYVCVPKGYLGGIEEHARTLKACIDLENVFQFVCGLSDDGAVKIVKHLKSVRISDPELDLSKTVPDVENDTDGPLCKVTKKHCSFSNLVLHSFRDVHLKTKFFNHFFDCTGDIVLVTEPLIKLLRETKANDLIQSLHSGVVFLVDNEILLNDDNDRLISDIHSQLPYYEIAEVPDFRNAVVRITESSEHLTLRDFLEAFRRSDWFCCSFSYILCFRNGQFRFYIRSLTLRCDYHTRLLTETTASSVQPRSASWCSEQSCLRFLRSFQCLGVMDKAICDVLESVSNLTSKCSLEVGDHIVGSRPLTSATVAKRLASLLPRFANVISLQLALFWDYSAAEVETLITSVTHKTLKELVLSRISRTPAAAAALGRSLPEMSSLEILALTGEGGGSLQTDEMEALFGRFNKTLPLGHLTFSGFNVKGSLAPLAKSFRFFSNLVYLVLGEVNMNEHNLFHLLHSLAFIPSLEILRVQGKPHSQSDFYSEKVDAEACVTHKTLKELVLSRISLTPAAAAALGRSLPEMSSLEILELTGLDGNSLQAVEMEALFGRVRKTLPLRKLTFSGFSFKSCLAPLTKSFRFFSNLDFLKLEEVNMNEHNLFHLLHSLAFFPSLKILEVECKPHSQSDFCLEKVDAEASFSHKNIEKLVLRGIRLTPAVAAMLGRSLPEMSSLEILELTGVDGNSLQAVEMEVLFGGFNKTLPLWKLRFIGFSIRGCLAPLAKRLRFFSNLHDLELGEVNMNEHNLFHLLQSLAFIPSLKILEVQCKPHSQSVFCSEKVDAEASFSHKNIKRLVLRGISLTPAVAAMLGRSLPEMSSLETLKLTGVDGSSLQAVEMEALFGGFNKTLPLWKLSFTGFSIRSCLAPLAKSLRFFPSLGWLMLSMLNMDEHDLHGLLEIFRFIPDLRILDVSHNPLGHAVTSIVPHVINLSKLESLSIIKTSSDEDLDYVRETVRQARPHIDVRRHNSIWSFL